MNSSYVFGGGDTRKISGPLPPGDYTFLVAECGQPYQKENGNWVLQVRLSIVPSGETVFATPWSGTDKNGEQRDGIGEFLLAVNRAPKLGQAPDWTSIEGARGRCRLKLEIASQGALAGKDVNRVAFFHRPKELGTYSPQEAEKMRTQTQQKVKGPRPGGELEPDDLPF